MKIVNLEEFVALPPGTLYHEYEPCVTGPLCVKYDTLSRNEWVVQTVGEIKSSGSHDLFDRLREMEDAGASFPIEFDGASRNGMFPNKGLFLVYETADVRSLIEHLEVCLSMVQVARRVER